MKCPLRKAKSIEGAKRAHRIRLLPTAEQERAFYGFAKVVRWTWNIALKSHNAQVAKWQDGGKEGDAPTIASLKPLFNQGRKIFASWTTEEGHRDCWSEPFTDLQKAFAAKRAGDAKHPQQKRFDAPSSFYVANDKFEMGEDRVRLPKVGWVKATEKLRFEGSIRGARVTRDGAGRWFLSVQVAGVAIEKSRGTEAIGIDVGITNAITLSTGEVFQAPRMSKREKAKMRRLQRSVSRKYEARKARRTAVRAAGGDLRSVNASKNEEKARRKVGKFHGHIADRRNDWQHKTTTGIVERAVAIGLETLSIKGMIRSKRKGQAKALSDIGLGEIHRQFRYKAEDGKVFVQNFERSYPSSQLCSSQCGRRQKMPLGIRIYRCPCGRVIDRDVNASLNLVPSAWRITRGTDPPQDRNTEEQAATSLLVVQPVFVESTKRRGHSHVRT